MISCSSVLDFNSSWASFVNTYNFVQGLAEYFNGYLFQRAHKFAQCYIGEFEHYGVKQNHFVEGGHAVLKRFSFLLFK